MSLLEFLRVQLCSQEFPKSSKEFSKMTQIYDNLYRPHHPNLEFWNKKLLMENPQFWSNFAHTSRDWPIHEVVYPGKYELNWTKSVNFLLIPLHFKILN